VSNPINFARWCNKKAQKMYDSRKWEVGNFQQSNILAPWILHFVFPVGDACCRHTCESLWPYLNYHIYEETINYPIHRNCCNSLFNAVRVTYPPHTQLPCFQRNLGPNSRWSRRRLNPNAFYIFLVRINVTQHCRIWIWLDWRWWRGKWAIK